jgi:hypothetical protein
MITSSTIPETERIYTRQQTKQLSKEEIVTKLTELMTGGKLTTRDEAILAYLQEVVVMSVDQVRRLVWGPAIKDKTVYERLRHLTKNYLLSRPRTPSREMMLWGLKRCPTYALGPIGQAWLKGEVDTDQIMKFYRPNQVLHDLLVSELFVRMSEHTRHLGDGWTFGWAGEQNAAFRPDMNKPATVIPDGLGIISQHLRSEMATLPFFVEMDAGRQAHGQYHHDWGRKIVGYDRFAESSWQLHRELSGMAHFPQVMVVTHGQERVVNLAKAIAAKRKKDVFYVLGEWQDVLIADNLFTAPMWIEVMPDGKIAGMARDQRRPLIELAPTQ